MSTYAARVEAVTDRGVFVTVFGSSSGSDPIGPCPTLVPDLEVGSRVLVADYSNRSDHYVVLGPIVDATT